MPAEGPAIALVDVYKSFEHHPVLRGINLEVARGTTLVIMGGSGSGKTVLLKHISGLLKPDRGQVLIDGEDISRMDEEQLRRVREKFGVVFQASALFDGLTVFDNVALPLRERRKHLGEAEVRRLVHQKLELFDLHEVDDKLPEELSGGMRKRVALARAVVLDPRFVLYDEPTTGLDPLLTESVDRMILRAKRELGVTSVVISHDVGAAFEVADQVAFLFDGQVRVRGTPAEVQASPDEELRRFLALWRQRPEASGAPP